MDGQWKPIPLDSARDVRVILHPTASMTEIRTGAATDDMDVSAMLSAGNHSQFDCNVTLNWNYELFGTTQPKPNQILELRLLQDGVFSTLWMGIIESISSYTLSRGERSLQLIARTRDSMNIFRVTKRVTELFPQLTDLSYIAMRVAEAAGLEADEIKLPPSSFHTAHSNTQLAEMSAWEMLEGIFLALGWTPFIDGQGRLRAADRNVQTRTPDIILTADRIVKVTAQRSRSNTTRVKVKWLDPLLKKNRQQGRRLGEPVVMTTGWWSPYWRKTVYFSEDKTQRAENTFLVVETSANLLIDFVSEKYHPLAENKGRIELINKLWLPTIIALIAAWQTAHNVPEKVVGTVTVPALGGIGVLNPDCVTVPATGRTMEGIAQFALMMCMMNIGTGTYEVWGTPYDWVHARNTTEAFDVKAPKWVDDPEEVESDFVMNEQHAKAIAVRELIYRSKSASKWTVVLVDDPRIEMGDILEFPDGGKLYVEDFQRGLTRGGEITVQVQGFLIGGVVSMAGVDTPANPVGASTPAVVPLLPGVGGSGAGGGTTPPVVVTPPSSGTTGSSTVTVSPNSPAAAATLPGTASGVQTYVTAGQDLQAAINAAVAGDTLLLEPATTWTGNYYLPVKSGTQRVTLTTDMTLPAPGSGLELAEAAGFAKILSPNNLGAISTRGVAHDYALVGLEVRGNGGTELIALGFNDNTQTTLAQVPTRLLVDRCYIHGSPTAGQRRGVALNCSDGIVTDCYISDIKIKGIDSQCIGGFNGPGPFLIAGNYLEGAGENVIFGGDDAKIVNLVPSDITITRNHFFKPLSWKGSVWQIKNLLELKNAKRVQVDSNVFENCWKAAQDGYAIVLTPRNQYGGATWSTVQDVNFEFNVIRQTARGFQISGYDNLHTITDYTARVRIANNLVYSLTGTLFVLVNGPIDALEWHHNTMFQPGDLVLDDRGTLTNYRVENNLLVHGSYGWLQSGGTPGVASINACAPTGYVWLDNVVGGSGSISYPTGTQEPTLAAMLLNFTDPAAADFSLVGGSAYRNAGNDGHDLGADISALLAAIAGVV